MRNTTPNKHPIIFEAPSSPSQEKLNEILKQTDKKELTSFVSQYASNHPDFFQALTSHLYSKKESNS